MVSFFFLSYSLIVSGPCRGTLSLFSGRGSFEMVSTFSYFNVRL